MIRNNFSPDISDFIRCLAKHGVDYAIVGGEAVIYYGHSRLTGDIDFFYDRSEENARKLFRALADFWDGSVPGLSDHGEFTREGTIVQFGQPPNRIDLINRIDGVEYNDIRESRVRESISISDREYPLYYIDLAHLIKNKKASGRNKDLEDLKFLERLQ